jgi:hypothetical protein
MEKAEKTENKMQETLTQPIGIGFFDFEDKIKFHIKIKFDHERKEDRDRQRFEKFLRKKMGG